jgi:hypothetical protein
VHQPRNAPIFAAIAGCALALVFVAVGCSGSDDRPKVRKVDLAPVEADIKAGIEKARPVTVAAVDCPDDVIAEKGGTFTCTVRATTGQTAEVLVTQEDDRGRVTWKLVQPSTTTVAP